MEVKHTNGFVEVAVVVIVACLVIGSLIAIKSKVIDSPAEQTVETILRAEGVDIDFSADKKRNESQSKAQVLSQAYVD